MRERYMQNKDTQPMGTPDRADSNPILRDRFGRHINYLRISVTDRCDLRCVYCMNETTRFLPRSQLLTLEEVARIGKAFADLGVSKIRITGGEPLVRKNVLHVFRELGQHPGIRDLTLTSNGTRLPHFARDLKSAGVTRINISLDTLRPDRFRAITRVGDLSRTLAGIEAARDAGIGRIKLNSVILKHRNHDEVADLVAFAVQHDMDISFIEEMPLGVIGDHDRAEAFYSSDAILADLQSNFTLQASGESTGGPSRYYRIPGSRTRVGFISPHSHNFCSQCNRVRLTAEGRLLLCLGQEHSVDLRRVVRAYPLDDTPLHDAIRHAMIIKPEGHDFDLRSQPVIFRHMNVTGG
jgi:cyclic pyranopterin phosphate synthase